jgi:prephenate dehydrogenase
MPFARVAIRGVGLIGGSIGKALKKKLGVEAVGIVSSASRAAVETENGKEKFLAEITQDFAEGVANADLVVVCSRVGDIPRHVREAAAHCKKGALITDVGSTKAWIVQELAGPLPQDARFVGGHPLAGSDKTGVENSRAELFEGRRVFLTKTPQTRGDDLAQLSTFWELLGTKNLPVTVHVMDATEHDRLVGAISHMPHLIAAALVLATERELNYCGPGWEDTTRIAAGDARIWRPIFESNRDNVLEALSRFERCCADLRDALRSGDFGTLTLRLENAAAHRNQVDQSRDKSNAST